MKQPVEQIEGVVKATFLRALICGFVGTVLYTLMGLFVTPKVIGQPKADAPATALNDPRTMTLVLQNELKRVGCKPGKVDGKWGAKGRAALARFNTHAELKLPTQEPTLQAIDAIKAETARVCPEPAKKQQTVKKLGQKKKKNFKVGELCPTPPNHDFSAGHEHRINYKGVCENEKL